MCRHKRGDENSYLVQGPKLKWPFLVWKQDCFVRLFIKVSTQQMPLSSPHPRRTPDPSLYQTNEHFGDWGLSKEGKGRVMAAPLG